MDDTSSGPFNRFLFLTDSFFMQYILVIASPPPMPPISSPSLLPSRAALFLSH